MRSLSRRGRWPFGLRNQWQADCMAEWGVLEGEVLVSKQPYLDKAQGKTTMA